MPRSHIQLPPDGGGKAALAFSITEAGTPAPNAGARYVQAFVPVDSAGAEIIPATQATVAALLTELGQKVEAADLAPLATSAKQDAAKATLDTLATNTTLTALSAKLPSALVDGRLDVNVGAAATLDTNITDRLARLLGHVVVDNFPATQPVSATALPLPTGAATEATLSSISDLLSTAGGFPVNMQNTSFAVSNFPATQPVSGTFWQATQPVSLAVNAPDVVDRVGRLLGHVTVDNPTDVSTLATAARQDAQTTLLGTLAGVNYATGADVATVTAKLSADPATQTTLAAVLAKVSAPADQVATLTDGRKTIGSAGSAEAIRASLACKWVTVTALLTNTAQVNVGGSSVLATSGTSTGTPLLAGSSITIPVTNANLVFVDARVNGEGVSFTVGA